MIISKTIKILTLLIIVSSSTIAFADEMTCPIKKSQAKRVEFKALYELKKFVEAEEMLSEYINSCTDEMYEEIKPLSLYYWLVSDLMLAQKKNGHFQQCITNGLKIVHMWGWGVEIEKERNGKAMSAIKFNTDQCRNNIPINIGISYTTNNCQIKEYETAIKIPESWGYSKQQGVCVYLNPGKLLSADEFENLPEIFDYKSLAPYLVIVKESEAGKIVEQNISFVDGKLSEGEYCGAPEIKTGVGAKNNLILLTGTYGNCWPGSAAVAIDAIYSLAAPNVALLKYEVSLPLH